MAAQKMKYTEIVRQKRITTVAGAWTFYFLTSLLPIVFLLITAFGVFGVDISADVVGRLPEEFRLAGETIFAAFNPSGPLKKAIAAVAQMHAMMPSAIIAP